MQMKASDAVDEESHYVSTPAQLIKHGRIRLEMTCEGTGEKLEMEICFPWGDPALKEEEN